VKHLSELLIWLTQFFPKPSPQTKNFVKGSGQVHFDNFKQIDFNALKQFDQHYAMEGFVHTAFVKHTLACSNIMYLARELNFTDQHSIYTH